MQNIDRFNSREFSVINGWLKELALVLNGDGSLSLASDGVCAIGHESGLVLIIENPVDSPNIYFYTSLMTLTGDPGFDYGLMKKALLLNQFGLKTLGGTLSYSSELNSIVLTFIQPIGDCDEKKFIEIFKEFLTTAIRLRKEFAELFLI